MAGPTIHEAEESGCQILANESELPIYNMQDQTMTFTPKSVLVAMKSSRKSFHRYEGKEITGLRMDIVTKIPDKFTLLAWHDTE